MMARIAKKMTPKNVLAVLSLPWSTLTRLYLRAHDPKIVNNISPSNLLLTLQNVIYVTVFVPLFTVYFNFTQFKIGGQAGCAFPLYFIAVVVISPIFTMHAFRLISAVVTFASALELQDGV